MAVAHAAVALYIVVEFGGLWLAIVALLFYLRSKSPAYLYFSMFFGSTMVMLIAEIVLAYWQANGLSPPAWMLLTRRLVYFAGELLHFFAVLRLAFALVNRRLPNWANRVHLGALGVYAIATLVLIMAGSTFALQHIVLGLIQVLSIAVILRNRGRLQPRAVRLVTLELVVTAAVFAPAIGLTVYTGLAARLPFGGMTVMVAYAVVAEIILTYHAVRNLFGRAPGNRIIGAPLEELSEREREIALLVSQGLTNREIAEKLHIAPVTVRNHLYHVYQKLAVRNRVELVASLQTWREPP